MSDLKLQIAASGAPISAITATSENDNIQDEDSRHFFMQALNSVRTNVMIADNNHDIIYMNHTARQMFRVAADALRTEIPHFDAENLIGNNIDVFHREPMRQRRILEHLGDRYTTNLTVGGRTFRLIANSISSDGKRLGTVLEWSDLTAQLRLEDEAHKRVEAEHFRKKKLMDSIIRELHHRIKNDLQGVVGLLRRSLSNVPESVPVIEDTIRQINAIATVYTLQSRSVSLNLKLEDMVTALITTINSTTQKKLKFSMSREGDSDWHVSEQDALSVSLIINELFTNAVKHGSNLNPDALISVSLDCQPKGVQLRICNAVENEIADFDFESLSGVGTGLKLVRSLLPEPGAQLSFDIEDGKLKTELAMQQPVVFNYVMQPE